MAALGCAAKALCSQAPQVVIRVAAEQNRLRAVTFNRCSEQSFHIVIRITQNLHVYCVGSGVFVPYFQRFARKAQVIVVMFITIKGTVLMMAWLPSAVPPRLCVARRPKSPYVLQQSKTGSAPSRSTDVVSRRSILSFV